MAADETRTVGLYQVTGVNRLLAETQVGHRRRTGFLGVIYEVALRVQVGGLADDLDAVLVGAHRPIAAQSVEQRLETLLVGIGAEAGIPCQAGA